MSESILRISEALSLAFHATAYLASGDQRPRTVKDIARRIKASEAHLSKVLQALARAGILRAIRGPRGGYSLAKKPKEITLLEIYEVIHGPLKDQKCLYEHPLCGGEHCILGNLISEVTRLMREHLSQTTLEKVKDVITENLKKIEENH